MTNINFTAGQFVNKGGLLFEFATADNVRKGMQEDVGHRLSQQSDIESQFKTIPEAERPPGVILLSLSFSLLQWHGLPLALAVELIAQPGGDGVDVSVDRVAHKRWRGNTSARHITGMRFGVKVDEVVFDSKNDV